MKSAIRAAIGLTFAAQLFLAPSIAFAQASEPVVALPEGPYQATCENARLDGRWLHADCKKNDGSMNASKIKYTECIGPIKNKNGRLSCTKTGVIG